MTGPRSVARTALTGTLEPRQQSTGPRHALAGYAVPDGTLLEVRLATADVEPTAQEPGWLPVHYQAGPEPPTGRAQGEAAWLVAVATTAGPRQARLELPPDALLRWPPQVPVIALGAAVYARLAQLARQLRQSFAALDRVYQDPRSGLPDLVRRLDRLDTTWVALAPVLEVWAAEQRRLSTQDLVLLEDLAQHLERTVATARGRLQAGVAENTRSVIAHESGRLLREAGWLRDLCGRVGRPGPR
jgi:hypothetical protein